MVVIQVFGTVLSGAVLCDRVVLEVLDHSVVTAASDGPHGYSDGDGRVVGVLILYQETSPLTVCHLSRRRDDPRIQLHWHRGMSCQYMSSVVGHVSG